MFFLRDVCIVIKKISFIKLIHCNIQSLPSSPLSLSLSLSLHVIYNVHVKCNVYTYENKCMETAFVQMKYSQRVLIFHWNGSQHAQ